MEGEVCNLVVDWSITLTSLLYSHGVGLFIPQGTTRFLLLLPIILLFIFLPLNLTTMFFVGPTSFLLSWLGTFKLILFAFGQGPLSSHPSLPLSHFIATACLPIKIIRKNKENSQKLLIITKKLSSSHIYSFEILLVLVVIKGYCYKHQLQIHPLLTMSFFAYFFLFTILLSFAMAAFLIRALLGVELEPQFDEPWLATSVQNFWGERWNHMVSGLLRTTIYRPARAIFSHLVPERWVSVPATFVTFLVSGIMHEMVLYYIGQGEITWELTLFFVIHGVLVGIEIVVKKTMDLRPSKIVSMGLTWMLLVGTNYWLFFPPFLRLDPCGRICGRICKESMAFLGFYKDGHLLNPNEFACSVT